MTGAIIQARMASTRLPGKTLKLLNGKPVLEYVIDAAKKADVDTVILATPIQDMILAAYAKEHDIKWYGGQENDVLARVYEASEQAKLDVIVRLTGDCPCVKPGIINWCIPGIGTDKSELVYNSWLNHNDGVDVEVFTMQLLRWTFEEAVRDEDREHVTPFMRRCPFINRIEIYKKYIDQKLSIDTEDDFKRVEKYLREGKNGSTSSRRRDSMGK
ncbi:MAG: hypothetical protein AMJ75_00275 [Phycisphaerae bacterium SM1_79]|nr:MAG: hypothetical protein AMJ75_00275 [Phycisphaerae bacterium SM1_79]